MQVFFFFNKCKKVECVLFASNINFKSKCNWKRVPRPRKPRIAQVILCPKKSFPVSLSEDPEFKYFLLGLKKKV